MYENFKKKKKINFSFYNDSSHFSKYKYGPGLEM